jgi:hypothetical protein
MVSDKPLEKSVSFQGDDVVIKNGVATKPKLIVGGAQSQQQQRQPPFKKRKMSAIAQNGNSFPLPPLKELKAMSITDNTKLISYQRLWGKLGSSPFQAELFRRKLAAGTVSLTGRTRSPIALLKRELVATSAGATTAPFPHQG